MHKNGPLQHPSRSPAGHLARVDATYAPSETRRSATPIKPSFTLLSSEPAVSAVPIPPALRAVSETGPGYSTERVIIMSCALSWQPPSPDQSLRPCDVLLFFRLKIRESENPSSNINPGSYRHLLPGVVQVGEGATTVLLHLHGDMVTDRCSVR